MGEGGGGGGGGGGGRRAERLVRAGDAVPMPGRAYPLALFLALCRAAAARTRAAWTARLSGSARRLRMSSRLLMRTPSARQAGEQYALGLPGPPLAAKLLPQVRHAGAAGPFCAWREGESKPGEQP